MAARSYLHLESDLSIFYSFFVSKKTTFHPLYQHLQGLIHLKWQLGQIIDIWPFDLDKLTLT